MSKLPKQDNDRIVVGFDNADDAGVYRLNDETYLVQTLDFFTPVADDPETYGRIAAVNSLNDVYAMGGTPLTAMSIVCYPQKGDFNVLGDILRGGHIAMVEEGVAVVGGHSVDDQEIKIGYSITGTVDPKGLITNAGAKPGDVLILSKPIGTGVINTAVKFEKASEATANAALKTMTISARDASKAMREANANACTDVTGFGLLGHAFEMASASDVTFEIESESVPFLPDVLELIEQKMLTRGDKNNREYVGENIVFEQSVGATMQSALYDPQTAGGLLLSIPREFADQFLQSIEGSTLIGTVTEKNGALLQVG
ncbi:MAG: selenide, water dikinase SelD [Pyrinomonadaceae bacterium]|nr:selenide, water dikinase SelD [Pyrinomonadaceae bacterium]